MGLGTDLCQRKRGEGCFWRRFDDDCASGCKSWSKFSSNHGGREVPRGEDRTVKSSTTGQCIVQYHLHNADGLLDYDVPRAGDR